MTEPPPSHRPDTNQRPHQGALDLESELLDLFDGANPPPELRTALLAQVHELGRENGARPRSPWPHRLVPAALAAAAAAMLFFTLRGGPELDTPTAGYDPCDLDRSGRVDVLDAYLLASALEAKGPVSHGLDLDGSGTVDRLDAVHVAKLAVRVNR